MPSSTPVFTGPGPLRTQVRVRSGLAWESPYPSFYRSGTAWDSPHPSFCRSGTAQHWPGTRRTPVLSGLGPARDSPYPSFYRSGTARDRPGTRRNPVFTGPGPPTPFGFYKIKSPQGGESMEPPGEWDPRLCSRAQRGSRLRHLTL